ncbi:polyprotein [Gossypium arboreum]|uniref:Polyprotein n=1 Tax=Gossypium arboreum TaxID=29729 RepID=A0A0B0PLT8_GOSAR|nr:polyprotein [Gossypium arboreum]
MCTLHLNCCKIKCSKLSTWLSTRACDLAVLHKSVYPTGLAPPSIGACVATSKGTWARHTGVWLAV